MDCGRRWIVLVVLLGSCPAGVAQEPVLHDGPLIVATRQVPPFAMKDSEDHWTGIAINLMAEVAEELNQDNEDPVQLQFRDMPLGEMLAAVEEGKVDLVAGALTVNYERENRMDFSHPFHTSGLGIAVAHVKGSGWLNVLDRLFSITMLEVLAALFALSLLAGVTIYLFERRANKIQFGGGFWRGLGAGIWWSIVTLTTVGYGDKAPQTVGGRTTAVLWMLSGLLIISSFTAAVTSALTVGQLRSTINGPQDLARLRVVTVSDSTSQSYLSRRQIRHRRLADLTDALNELQAGRADAVVYDAPLLRYQVVHDFPMLHVLPMTFERQDYAIAMPSGSPLREPVNRAILRVISKPSWDATLENYLGAN